MSTTDTPVTKSVAVTYPLGSNITCSVNKMPLSSQKSMTEAEVLNDDGICSMDSSENSSDFGLNLKDTLQGLQSLNGQSTFQDDHIMGLNRLPGFGSAKDDLSNKTCSKENDADIVILDDVDKIATDNVPKNEAKLQSDGRFNTSNNTNSKVVSLFDTSKQNPFTINDKVRSSIRDIMTKIQVNTPSLGNLLSKTKYIDCKDPNCKNLAEKNRIESEQSQLQQQNGMSSKGSGNLFENLQEINKDSAQNKCENHQKHTQSKGTSTPENSTPEVIELDDSVEDDQIDQKDEEKLDEEPSPDDVIKVTKSHFHVSDDSDIVKQSESSQEENIAAIENTDSGEKLTNVEDENSEINKQNCDIISKEVQSSDVDDKMEVDSDRDTDQPNIQNEELKESEKNELDSLEECEKVDKNEEQDVENTEDGEVCLDDEDQEMKDEEEEEMKIEEEDKLLASDSETSEESQDSINRKPEEPSMDVEDEEGSESKDSVLSTVVKEDEDKKPLIDEIKVEPLKNEKQDINFEDSVLDDVKKEIVQEDVKSENGQKDVTMEVVQKDIKNEGAQEDVKEDAIQEDVKREADQENVKKEGVHEDVKKEDIEESVAKDVKESLDHSLDVKDSNSNDSCDRKRPADTDASLSSTEPKRSRLDFVIGKLGSQIGIKPESLPLEDDTCVSDTEDSTRPDSEDSSKSDDTSSSVSETEETEETEEEKSPRKKKKKKPIRLTRKELENLIKSKINSYLKSERPRIIQELQTKVDELQEANEKWKQRAKDLEKQMLDLTVLQQKHEKRKAKTAALRQISTKSVAVQVDENKANMMSRLGQQQCTTPQKQISKTPPKTAVSLALPSTQLKSAVTPPNALTQQRTNTAPMLSTVPPKLTPMTITQVPNSSSGPKLIPVSQPQTIIPGTVTSSSAPRSVFPSNQTVKSLLDSTRQPPNGAPKFVAQPPATNFIMVNTPPTLISSVAGSAKTSLSKTNSSIAQAIAVASSNQQIHGATPGTVKVIDLTGEEENAAKKGLLTQNPIIQTAIRPPVFTQQVVRPVMSSQPGLGQNQVIRPVVSGQPGLGPNQGILLSTAAGTQIVRGSTPQAYQLVFNPTSPAIRPGSLLTVVTAPNNATAAIRPTTSYIPSAAPQASITTVPPQLRTGQVVTTAVASNSVPKTDSIVNQPPVVRPPPPLQSAPPSKSEDTKRSSPEHNQHPAPLPPAPIYHIKPNEKPLPPQPTLKISRVSQGIVLSWNMTLSPGSHAGIKSYQLFAYQEGSLPPSTSLWKKVGDVKALPLPMACTLTQFQEGNHYHFAVRPVDVNDRIGSFSKPSSIHLTKKD